MAGGYVGRKMNRLVKCAGTAFIGAFLVVRGIGYLAPKGFAYPSQFSMSSAINDDPAAQTAIWLYLGGLVALTVGGTALQLYFFRDISKDTDDQFDRQGEARVCGCF